MATKTKRAEMLIVGWYDANQRRDFFYAGDGQAPTDIRDDAAVVDRRRACEIKAEHNFRDEEGIGQAYIDDACHDRYFDNDE